MSEIRRSTFPTVCRGLNGASCWRRAIWRDPIAIIPKRVSPLSAMVSEVRHGGTAFQNAYAACVAQSLLDRQADYGDTPPGEDIALLALAIGGLALARALPDPTTSDAVLQACRDASAILADAFEEQRGEDQ